MATPSIRNASVRPSAIRWTQGDTLPPVDATGNAAPLLVDATTGKLLVDAQANVSADLTLIEGKMDTANGISTTQAADVATIKGNTTFTKGSGPLDSNTQRVTLATDGPTVANLSTIATNTAKVPGFSLPAYDYISCSYTGTNLTGVVYKTGGSSGTTVATLTLGYDGSNNLTSVTKS